MSRKEGPLVRAGRKFLVGVGGIFWLGAAAVLYAFGYSAAAAVIGLLAGFVLGMMVLVETRSDASRADALPDLDDMDTASRIRLRPMFKLREEILRLMETHGDNPVVAVISFDTTHEVDSMLRRSAELMAAKRRVQRLAGGIFRARAMVADLEAKLSQHDDEAARSSIESALAARREELRNYEQIELTEKRLEANLEEAESALAELRSKLLLSVAERPDELAKEEVDPLSEMTSRLKRLTETMEESIETISMRGW